MPTRPTVRRRNSRGPPHGWTPLAGDVVLLGALINLSYAAMLIYALAHPNAQLGVWVTTWVQAAANILKPAYILAGPVGCGGAGVSTFVARTWDFYINLVAFNLIVATALFAASRRYWIDWFLSLYGPASRRYATADARRQGAEAGFGTVIWGAIAVLWWLILGNDFFDSGASCSAAQPWILLRAPLLTTSAHGFASLAAAFWAGRNS